MAISNADLLKGTNKVKGTDNYGNVIDVYLKDGTSYLSDGSRLKEGYTVQTGGGIYKMGSDNKGYKVDSHNQGMSNEGNAFFEDNFYNNNASKYGVTDRNTTSYTDSPIKWAINGAGEMYQVDLRTGLKVVDGTGNVSTLDPNKPIHMMDGFGNTSIYDGGYGGGGGGGGGRPTIQLPPVPEMRSGRSMAELLGIDYNLENIEGRYRDAAEKKYANLDAEFGRTQDIFYDSVGASADVLMGALRRGDREAMRAGTAQGTQASQELSAMLGATAESMQGATELAQGRSDLVYAREAEMAKIAVDALKYYNDLGINLGQLSASELNALTQAYAAQVSAMGGIYNTDVLASVERDRIQSQEKIEEANRISRENIATWGNASAEEIAKITGKSALDVENLRAEYNKEIAGIQADAQKDASQKNKEIAELNAKYNAKLSSGNWSNNSNSGTSLSSYEQSVMAFTRIDQLTNSDGTVSQENLPAYKTALQNLEKATGMDWGSNKIEIASQKPIGPEYKPYAPLVSIPQINSDLAKKFGAANWKDRYPGSPTYEK